jgi:hypothetical protein
MLRTLWRRLLWGREERYRHAAERVRRPNAETEKVLWREMLDREAARRLAGEEPKMLALFDVFLELKPSLLSRLRSWWWMRAGSL